MVDRQRMKRIQLHVVWYFFLLVLMCIIVKWLGSSSFSGRSSYATSSRPQCLTIVGVAIARDVRWIHNFCHVVLVWIPLFHLSWFGLSWPRLVQFRLRRYRVFLSYWSLFYTLFFLLQGYDDRDIFYFKQQFFLFSNMTSTILIFDVSISFLKNLTTNPRSPPDIKYELLGGEIFLF